MNPGMTAVALLQAQIKLNAFLLGDQVLPGKARGFEVGGQNAAEPLFDVRNLVGEVVDIPPALVDVTEHAVFIDLKDAHRRELGQFAESLFVQLEGRLVGFGGV